MKMYYRLLQLVSSLLLIAGLQALQEGYAQNSVTFNCTGASQNWTVPNCVDTITVVVAGAGGGGWNSGDGATVTADIPVTPGEVLEINVGCAGSCPFLLPGPSAGWNGGGSGQIAIQSPCGTPATNGSCDGGGGSDIRQGGTGLADRVIVAAGGGGMGGGDTDAGGGDGGCNTGAAGGSPWGVGGGGGSQNSGGFGGPPWIPAGMPGGAGGLGFGGDGGIDICYQMGPGAGGGGGYYGGGGGGSDCWDLCPLGGGGGGGGSSLVPPGGSCTAGNNSGDGQIIISYDASNIADATITPAGPFCVADGSVTLTAADPGGTWSGNGITDPTAGTFDPAVAGTDTHTIIYTIIALCGDSDTIDIIVTDSTDATITPAGPFCIDDGNETLSAATAGGTWSGNGIIDPSDGIFDPAAAGTGTHAITYIISGGNCGDDTDTTLIEVYDTANASFLPAGPFCLDDDNTTLNAADPGGTWSGNGIIDSLAGIFDPGVAGIGVHGVTYAIGGLCGDTTIQPIEVVATADATISPAGPFCMGDSIDTLNTAGRFGTWSGNGIIDSSAGVFDPGVAGAGTHTITYAVSGMCGDTAAIQIEVFDSINADFLPLNTSNCAPLTVQFENPSKGGETYYWDFGNGNTSTATYPEVTYQVPGIYSVQLIASNPGCADDTLRKDDLIVVFGSPEAAFQPQPDKALTDEQILFDNLSVDALMWQWDFGDGHTESIQSPAYSYTDAGTYSVMLAVENEDGCTDTAYQTVLIVPEFDIGIPNAFTPNGDKLNNVFKPEGKLEGIMEYEMQIWNRWGEQVFASTDKQVGWNGRRNNTGQQAVPGTYFYQIKVTDFLEVEYRYDGYLFLIR